MLVGVSLALAILIAAGMGLAIQRGSTCTVAAIEEWHSVRRLTRLTAMVEASLWVCAGLLLARHWGFVSMLPSGYALGPWTAAGAVLLGVGAVVNRACVIGTVARLGSGQWAYGATPLGFYLGSASVVNVFHAPTPEPLAGSAPLASLPAWAAWLLLTVATCRLAHLLWRRQGSPGVTWSPHAATLAIAVAFVILLVLAGAWTYTDVLAELARGMAADLPTRFALCAALLFGALLGGWQAGASLRRRPTLAELSRCLSGGLLMGWGGSLIPGGNDALVLVGMPMLWPYAWVAFGVMVVVIGLLLKALVRA